MQHLKIHCVFVCKQFVLLCACPLLETENPSQLTIDCLFAVLNMDASQFKYTVRNDQLCVSYFMTFFIRERVMFFHSQVSERLEYH